MKMLRRLLQPDTPAACEQKQQQSPPQQQQQQQQVAPLAAAADFVGLKILGGGAAAAAADQPAADSAAAEAAAAATAAAAAGGRRRKFELDAAAAAAAAPYISSSSWQRGLAYSLGLYTPQQLQQELNPNEIAAAVAAFKQTLEDVNPNDACKYLQLAEYKCLKENQAHRDPETASTKCVKWFQEWRQCKWDEEKLERGYTYIESIPERKHKPYIATPDYQYS